MGGERKWFLDVVSRYIIQTLENLFYKWGKFVVRRPLITAGAGFLVALLCMGGLANFRVEYRGEKVFLPSNSLYVKHDEWLDVNFPRTLRIQSHLYEKGDGANVLNKETLLLMLEAHKSILKAKSKHGNWSWNDACYKIPIANLFITKKRRKRQADDANSTTASIQWDDYDLSDYESFYNESGDVFEHVWTKKEDGDDESDEIIKDLPPKIYCDLINNLSAKCLESSLLEIWKFDEKRVKKLSQKDILDAVNRYRESPEYGYRFNYTDLLGTKIYNSTGHVIGAKSIIQFWYVERDNNKPLESSEGGAELNHADRDTLAWEDDYLKRSFELQKKAEEKGYTMYLTAGKSYNDVTRDGVKLDLSKLFMGYFLMFAYTLIMLGKFNLVEIRLYLTIAGLTAIILGVLMAYGIVFALGFPFTTLLQVLIFLCLGVGIDDMFVIVQCVYNLPRDSGLSIEEKMGLALRHAGVAITVTSLTDILAFGIGTITIIPGLQSFCLACSLGILAIFFLQLSWFVAWFSIDEKRVEDRRNGIVPCYRHKDWEPSKISQKEIWKIVLTKLSSLYQYKVAKAIILLLTAVLFGFGVWGSVTIPVKYDTIKNLPIDSYLERYLTAQKRLFPEDGTKVEIYFGTMTDVAGDLVKLDKLLQHYDNLIARKEAISEIECWWPDYKNYLQKEKNISNWREAITEKGGFYKYLSDFLFTTTGAKYKNDFRFAQELVCNEPASKILSFKYSAKYFIFDGPSEHVPGRKALNDPMKNMNFSTYVFSFDKTYAEWEIDDVIGFELWRNLALAMVGVFIIILLLLVNFKICLMVQACVTLTLIDMIGFLNFWGTTLDLSSCILIILTIGICVDYSAHIGHSFLIQKGTRLERAVASVTTIGPAVLNGGITTFLATVFLSFSQIYPFRVFFRVFFFAVLFGLFHGLMFLPVILSLIGPEQAPSEPEEKDSNTEGKLENGKAQTEFQEISLKQSDRKSNYAYENKGY